MAINQIAHQRTIPSHLLRLMPLLGLLAVSGCEERRTTVVYPPATPSPPADFTPIGEGMKVFSFALLAMTVVISITVLISTRLRP
jgi:hypothetical protein